MYLSLSQHSLNHVVFSVSAKMKHQDCGGAPKDRCDHSVKGMFHYCWISLSDLYGFPSVIWTFC